MDDDELLERARNEWWLNPRHLMDDDQREEYDEMVRRGIWDPKTKG